MRFQKHHLCHLPFCYAVGAVSVRGHTKYIFATDDQGPCYAIDPQTGQRETVWEGPGGTMSIVPLPNREGTFLASQNFMPGFSAAHAKIVMVSPCPDGTWKVVPWLDLPYVHRFDILERNGYFYFLGCTLSSTKQEQARWDEPGALIVAPISPEFDPPTNLTTIASGMSRNHGYFRLQRPQYTQAYTACDQGVFQITPPEDPSGNWNICQLLNVPASDVAVVDLDGDGQEELATIEPFHGSSFVIYHKQNDHYQETYRYPYPAPFLHALWGGFLQGNPVFLAGCRDGTRELFLIQQEKDGPRAHIIETGYGPSNVAVLPGQHQDIILIANRQCHEGAYFTVTREDLP